MKIANSIAELVGNTPIMKLNNYMKNNKLNATILAKIESFNPLSSVKDRVAIALIEDIEKKGLINSSTTIIEPTSGNTGIALAAICASRAYKLILTMPETMSIERRKLLKHLGAEIVLTDGKLGMLGSIEKAHEINESLENSVILGQFTNIANPEAHKKSTAIEIMEDTKGDIDFFVSTVGSGGTITGVGETLKKYNKNIKIIAVEPSESPFLSSGKVGKHGIQGIGAGFLPDILNKDIIDEYITVSTEEAIACSKEIAKSEGLLVGISSGAAICAAKKIASKNENTNILTILPDTGERYLSTALFDD